MGVIACLRKLSINSKRRGKTLPGYCSFAYSASASLRMGGRGRRLSKGREVLVGVRAGGGEASKMFNHPGIATYRGCWQGQIFPVVRRNGPSGLEVFHPPQWMRIAH
jgi:hypothetical protein